MKIRLLAIVAVTALVLAACGQATTETPTTDVGVATTVPTSPTSTVLAVTTTIPDPADTTTTVPPDPATTVPPATTVSTGAIVAVYLLGGPDETGKCDSRESLTQWRNASILRKCESRKKRKLGATKIEEGDSLWIVGHS